MKRFGNVLSCRAAFGAMVLGPCLCGAHEIAIPAGQGFDGLVRVQTGGALRTAGKLGVTLRAGAYAKNWSFKAGVATAEGLTMRDDGSWPFRIVHENGSLAGEATFAKYPDGRIVAKWTAVPAEDAELNGLVVAGEFDAGAWGGGAVVADGRRVELGRTVGKPHLLSGAYRKLTFVGPDGTERFTLSFAAPQALTFQDDRAFGEIFHTFTLRLHLAGSKVVKGETYALSLSLSGRDAADFRLVRPVTVAAGEDWIPVETRVDVIPGSAVDFSEVIPCRHRPAGTFGRVVAKGGQFEFEGLPGVPQRFAGANVCGPSSVIEERFAAPLAKRLAAVGYNSVRIHNHDWAFCGRQSDGTSLDEGAMRRFDALFAAFKDEGLYVTTDFFVNRKIPWRSCGVDRDGVMSMNDFKVWSQFHEGTFSNFLAHARAFLSRVNARTGLRYADDPALAFVSFVNEANLGNYGVSAIRACPAGAAALESFVAAHGGTADKATLDRFYAARERLFARRVTAFLREEMKCRILTSNMNTWYYTPEIDEVRRTEFDYADQHHYVAHPRYLGKQWSLPAECETGNPLLGPAFGLKGRRLAGVPFACSEWNFCMMNEYRAQAGLAMGLLSASDGWSALWRYAWSDNIGPVVAPDRVPLAFFMIGADPLALATERAVTCLFLRHDGDQLAAAVAAARDGGRLVLDSGRTSGGWTDAGTLDAGFLRATVDTPAAVWASVLDGNSLKTARRILLVHLTEVLNDGMRFGDETRKTILTGGKVPLVARRGRAAVSLDLPAAGWKAYALAPDGRRTGDLPLREENGRLSFTSDVRGPDGKASLYCELTRR